MFSIHAFYIFKDLFAPNLNPLHLTQTCVTTTIPAIHSSIWWRPSPGHRPRLDPKKLRESMKLNWSTEVFFTRTYSQCGALFSLVRSVQILGSHWLGIMTMIDDLSL